jgi:GTPase
LKRINPCIRRIISNGVYLLFLDQAKIFLKSGSGGNGVISFRREKYVPRGGPDGGDGGRGGHIIFVVDNNLSTLSDFRYKHHFKAIDGFPGEASNRSGKDGEDVYIPVPEGTVIFSAETGKAVADLNVAGTKTIFLRGGRGGRGNSHFATATRQVPQIAEKGEPGLELWVELELKLLADVGLIGFPNVGKSTLLSRISAAKPKIADYPFTTLVPNLGVVDFKGQSFVAADLPGLIEGAHQGIGLGDQFLRHSERTRLLVHLVDVSGLSGKDPYQDYLQINHELQAYNPKLAEKPQLVVANKIDLPGAHSLVEDFQAKLKSQTVIPISAATGEGITELLNLIIQKLAQIPMENACLDLIEPEIFSEDDKFMINVIKDGEKYLVQSSNLLKRLARFDLENDDSIRSLQRLLKRWGIEKALIEAGVKEGDSVRIGDYEFLYYSED